MASFSRAQIEFFVNHLFLPPELPQKDDFDSDLDEALIRLVTETLDIFSVDVSSQQQAAVRHVLLAIQQFASSRDAGGAVEEARLLRALEKLTDATPGTSLPLHIRAQNAGVMISRGKQSIDLEAFELSATNHAVMSTQGRLRRCFPGPAITIPQDLFSDTDLKPTIARVFSRMSFQKGVGMTPIVRKSQNDVEEIRDTTHPGLVTELVFSSLGPDVMPYQAKRVWKHTREEVLWQNARLPWGRSPLWLHLRVVMQLLFGRYQDSISNLNSTDTQGKRFYKLFMLRLLAVVLDKALSVGNGMKPELLHCMSAKIVRRMLKLGISHNEPGMVFVKTTLLQTEKHVSQKWIHTQVRADNSLDLARLKSLQFEQDVTIALPNLDAFLAQMASRDSSMDFPCFSPSPDLKKFPAVTLPTSSLWTTAEYQVHNLSAIEDWIASHLGEWLDKHRMHLGTCEALESLMSIYHGAASSADPRNPERESVMILIVLELWMACDQSATAQLPMLEDYNPGVPVEHLQCLVLPTREQMVRLRAVEDYLKARARRARYCQPGSIFKDFGTSTCFSVRYFDKSREHQELKRKIEEDATEERRRKCDELARKKAQYNKLMQESDTLSHNQVQVYDRFGINSTKHSDWDCRKCQLRSEAKNIDIEVHEWPLPPSDLAARSVVFELNTPPAFCNWRDATIFLIQNVLGSKYRDAIRPNVSYRLREYSALWSYNKGSARRIELLSETKPHVVTHRKRKSCDRSITKSDVCLNNGLCYRYYDGGGIDGGFVCQLVPTDRVLKACTYQLPGESSALQKFLSRSFQGEDSTPNEVISSQSECPLHLSVAEFRALASIPVGHRLQWTNILVQLSCPAIDLKKPEASLVMLQAMYQAGPLEGDNFRRGGHTILADDSFADKLLTAVADASRRIAENWESVNVLSVLIAIATRQLSLNSSPATISLALETLSQLRVITFHWVQVLKTKLEDARDNNQRTLFMEKLVENALVCCGTFDVDDGHLEEAALTNQNASVFIQCSTLVHDYYARKASSSQGSLAWILHRRWQQLSYRAYPILANAVLQKSGATCLDDALKASWPSYHRGDPWQSPANGADHWVISNTKARLGRSLRVHYNLLTGKLLVNGLPLTRLPSLYEQTDPYQELFGDAVLQIVPSSVPGMRFSSQQLYMDYSLDFGHDDTHMLLRTTRDNQTFELIPRNLFRERLPQQFLNNYFHWYNVTTGEVEFRDTSNPWSTNDSSWRLRINGDTPGRWTLATNSTRLVDPSSNTGKALAAVLAPLQQSPWLSIVLSADSQMVEIDLPRLQLNFHLQKGTSSVISRKQRGFKIDSSQSISTLVGLKNKLVMRKVSTNERKVIIPAGHVKVVRDEDHVAVSIKPVSGPPHVYAVDEMLQKLTDNGNLQSKLFLCYLHGVTSYCLPDPLTSRTGTEQALSILKSAAVRSFAVLQSQARDLLLQIDSLTPRRVFYPSHLKDMQSVTWKSNLPVLSQHPHFHLAVQQLFNQNQMAQLYQLEGYQKPPRIKDVDPGLLRRDSCRSSTFRIFGFGAEDFTADLDVTYSPRDSGQSSERATRAKIVSGLLFEGVPCIPARPSCFPGVAQHILETLKRADDVKGPVNPDLSSDSLVYDAKWLHDHPEHWAEMWCWLHEHAQRGMSVTGPAALRFRIMMWFSTMAFAPEADLNMIHTAASMFLAPGMQNIRPLQMLTTGARIDHFCLREGDTVDQSRVRTIINSHVHSLHRSPENRLRIRVDESSQEFQRRRHASYRRNQDAAVDKLLMHIVAQFPAPYLNYPESGEAERLEKYIDTVPAVNAIRAPFRTWYENHLFTQYLMRFQEEVKRQPLGSVDIQALHFDLPNQSSNRAKSFLGPADFFSGSPPESFPSRPRLPAQSLLSSSHLELSSARLESLVQNEELRAKNKFERTYAKELRQSQKVWQMDSQSTQQQHVLNVRLDQLRCILEDHLLDSQKHAGLLFDMIVSSVREGLGNRIVAESLQHSPRLSPVFLLHQLSQNGWEDGDGWESLPETWKPCIVAYGMALTEVQRARRLIRSLNDHNELVRELQNEGHSNWDPVIHPDSLLLEVEGNLLIRNVQEEIAVQMRSPPEWKNTVMQLNMGEGKSSVIVPMLTLALADRSQLVRVIVGKPQSRQMFQMLMSKLGGLLNRRIFHLPFSRALQLTDAATKAIFEECRLCMETRGVMLVQPEHILSFKLMGLESVITGNEAIGFSMLHIQDFLDTRSRDIVDESDENFNVKLELVYTMGTQASINFAPERWLVVQTVLGIMTEHISAVKKALPQSIEVPKGRPGAFPRLRLLKDDATDMLLRRVTDAICSRGFPGFPISQQPVDSRQAVKNYITHPRLSHDEAQRVESSRFWTESTKGYILLLRGLFANGILAFVFGQKRWRVNYGLDNVRCPPTKLAVPYRAKDSPAPRAEFSQPDVVITLTCLSYYYGGLDDDDLFLTFNHLVDSDQANDEYLSWVRDSNALPDAFRQLMGINLEDSVQCKTEIFPSFRYAKRTIDYFLQHIVFPKQMKEFPQKLSASGWDLGAVKIHPTTGFSGTIDSKSFLPFDVQYLDLPDQKGTNARVLEYLLRPENEVAMLPPIAEASRGSVTEGASPPSSDAEALLDVVLARGDPCLRVILDVGAQILELTNAQVAEMWLRKARDQDKTVQAVIYFDDNEEMLVLDVSGSSESFWTSPYADQLDNCLVFLDEAHTRGTDLKLPNYYRAAVTLGAGLTKDRLVQACMRMRKLGKGQSVVFCVPQDIQTKIREHESQIERASSGQEVGDFDVQAVLSWAIGETIRDIRNGMPLWDVQGRRFDRQTGIWQAARDEAGINMSKSEAEKFLEEEAQTVERRYRPRAASGASASSPPVKSSDSSERLRSIKRRCMEIGALSSDKTTLQEEQERELAPENEEERQIERPPPARPAAHSVHHHVRQFASSAVLVAGSPAFMPAFHSLLGTTAAAHLDPRDFPTDILVTKDFAKTIKTSNIGNCTTDAYQRPVQWILTSQPRDWKRAVIISPHEAQELLPEIRKSSKTTLHVYSPRPSQEFSPLDTLDLYTVPSSTMRAGLSVPLNLRAQLNLFSGQLYFSSVSEYIELCRILRLSHQEATESTSIAADGFILSSTSSTVAAIIQSSTFTSSPVKFLKTFLTKTRRDCQSIEKTHLGRILDGALLQESDFDP